MNMKQIANVVLVLLAAWVVVLAWMASKNIRDAVIRVPVQAVIYVTPSALPVEVVNPVVIVTLEPVQVQPTSEIQVTADAFWTAQAQPRTTGRIGEGTPTAGIGSRDMSGDKHRRTP